MCAPSGWSSLLLSVALQEAAFVLDPLVEDSSPSRKMLAIGLGFDQLVSCSPAYFPWFGLDAFGYHDRWKFCTSPSLKGAFLLHR